MNLANILSQLPTKETTIGGESRTIPDWEKIAYLIEEKDRQIAEKNPLAAIARVMRRKSGETAGKIDKALSAKLGLAYEIPKGMVTYPLTAGKQAWEAGANIPDILLNRQMSTKEKGKNLVMGSLVPLAALTAGGALGSKVVPAGKLASTAGQRILASGLRGAATMPIFNIGTQAAEGYKAKKTIPEVTQRILETTPEAIGGGFLMGAATQGITEAKPHVVQAVEKTADKIQSLLTPKERKTSAGYFVPAELVAGAGGEMAWRGDKQPVVYVSDAEMRLKQKIPQKPMETTLGKMIKHEPLFEQFPDAKNIKVIMYNDDPNIGGQVMLNKQGDVTAIKINIDSSTGVKDNPKAFFQDMIHEIQHNVQRQTGMPTGTNLEQGTLGDYWRNTAEAQSRAAERLVGAKTPSTIDPYRGDIQPSIAMVGNQAGGMKVNEADPAVIAAREFLATPQPQKGTKEYGTWKKNVNLARKVLERSFSINPPDLIIKGNGKTEIVVRTPVPRNVDEVGAMNINQTPPPPTLKPSEDVVFTSPNVLENTKIDDALKALKSEHHTYKKSQIEEINKKYGEYQTVSGIGDWKDGAEDTTVTTFNAATPKTLEKVAAEHGIPTLQKQVATFYNDPKAGSDTLYVVDVPSKDVRTVASNLDKVGVQFRTFVDTMDGGTKVLVIEPKGTPSLVSGLKSFAANYGTNKVELYKGLAKFIGSEESRKASRQIFETIAGKIGAR